MDHHRRESPEAKPRLAQGRFANRRRRWWRVLTQDVGIDGLYYHLPEVVAWVHGGSPGSIEPIHGWLEVGNYPLIHEVLVAWGMGISQSLVWQGLLTLAILPAALVAGWIALRGWGVPEPVSGLTIVAVFSVPILFQQVDGAAADVPSLTWLLCAAGLGVASRDQPLILVPTVIAAGLAVGTKTTVLPLTALLVVALAIRNRDRLREYRIPIAAAAGLAAVLGMTWYLRDLVNHGSPFWPFAATPWGDPVPPLFDSYTSMLRGPADALEGNVDGFAVFLAGGWVIMLGALLAPLWSRTRPVGVGAALTFASILLWSAAPTTGVTQFEAYQATTSSARYLLPTVALAATTLALSARAGGVARTIAMGLLGGSSAWSLVQIATGDAIIFSKTWLAGAGLIGALTAFTLGRLAENGGVPLPRRPIARAAAAVLAIAGVGLVLSVAASGYTARYAAQDAYFDAGVVRWFEEPGRIDDGRPIRMAPEVFGMLAGDELARRVELIDLAAPCQEVERINREGWVIFRDDPALETELGYTANSCLGDRRPMAEIGAYRIYSPTSA